MDAKFTSSEAHGNLRVIICDDNPRFHRQLRFDLRQHYEFEGIVNISDLWAKLKTGEHFDLLLLDLVMEEESNEKVGLDVLPILAERYPGLPVIVITNYSDFTTAVEAMRRGALDFFPKNEYDADVWDQKIRQAVVTRQTQEENKKLKQEKQILVQKLSEREYTQPPNHPFLGESSKIERIRRNLKIMADEPNAVVLLTGETGVGKGVAARFFHYNSQLRRSQPFEEIHISAITSSLLESTLFGAVKGSFTDAKSDMVGRLQLADKGVVFLDEIGDVTLENQQKLLQFLQSKTIKPMGGKKDILLDVSIVAATNKILPEEIAQGRFRLDLYQRLNVFTLEIPPLRERREDIWPLMLHFFGLPEDQLKRLLERDVQQELIERYTWEGNIRQLEHTVRKMRLEQKLQNSKTITWDCLPEEIRMPNKSKSPLYAPSNAYQGIAPSPINVPAPSFAAVPAPPATLSIEEREAWQRLMDYERLFNQYHGHKGDVAAALNTTTDLLRYYTLAIYKRYPRFFQDCPMIRRCYKLA